MVQWDVYDGTQWVTDVRDPSVSTDGATFTDVTEAWVYDAGTWKKFYVREVQTAISANVSGGTYTGDSVTVSGAVLDDQGQPVPGEGDVLIESGYNDGNWTTRTTVALQANGQYSATITQSDPGGIYYRATFQPDSGSFFVTAQQVSAARSLALRNPTVSYGSVTDTSYAATCSAVTGADTYEWQENSSTFENDASRSISRTGKPNYTTYTLRVRSQAVTPNGTVSSGWVTRQVRTGRPEIRDSGTSAYLEVDAQGRGQYRRDVGWGYVGSDVRQGYYSSSYGGAGYFGVMDYGTRVRDALNSAIGSTRRDKGTCNFAEVYLCKESGVGTGGTVTIGFYASDRGVGGSEPNLEGSKYSATSPSGGACGWVACGSSLVQRLGDYTSRSLVTYQTSSPTGNYASFNGGSTGRLKFRWTWNYVTQTDVPGTWL